MIERGIQVDHSTINDMGTSIFPWNRKEDKKTFKTNKLLVESWWNIYQSKR